MGNERKRKNIRGYVKTIRNRKRKGGMVETNRSVERITRKTKERRGGSGKEINGYY